MNILHTIRPGKVYGTDLIDKQKWQILDQRSAITFQFN